jgi:hypothetical protein
MCLALPRVVPFPGRFFPPARSCRRRGKGSASRARVLAATLLAVAPGARAETPKASPFPVTESVVWAAHFEGWVDRLLSAGEIEAARRASAVTDPDASYRVLLELARERTLGIEREPGLPEGAVPPLAAEGISGEALRAARLYAQGQGVEALAVLRHASLARDPGAAHLRAQLRDEIERDVPAWQRLDVVQEYRLAISLGGEPATVAHARVRIAQIQLELGFAPEAMAALRLHLDGSLPAPFGAMASLSYAEAALRVRAYPEALEALEAAPRDQLGGAGASWIRRAVGDARFRLEQYGPAAEAYAAYTTGLETPGPQAADPLTQARWAFALLRSDQAQRAAELLRPILQQRPSHELATLLGLLLVEAHAQAREYERMQQVAEDALARDPDSPDAPLAALFVLEAQRLRGLGLKPPGGVAELARFDTAVPAQGLLAFRIETGKASQDQGQKTLGHLAELTRALPDGSVKALVHDELAARLIAGLRKTPAGQALDPSLLDTIEAQLSPRQMEEDELLLSIDALRSAGRFETCAAWALALREREVRPLRRGLGAWRKAQCEHPVGAPAPAPAPPAEGAAEGETEVRKRSEVLLEISDSGEAGPYSLAFAALAAEEFVKENDIDGAVRVYERGLESFAEPLLIGPVLLRLGELHASSNRESLARQRLVRGLTLTEGDVTAADPFRKVGTVLLARLVAQRGDPARLREFLRRDVGRLEPWWPAAYTFLGSRVGLELSAPASDDPFSEAAAEIERTGPIRARLRAVAERKAAAAPGATP